MGGPRTPESVPGAWQPQSMWVLSIPLVVYKFEGPHALRYFPRYSTPLGHTEGTPPSHKAGSAVVNLGETCIDCKCIRDIIILKLHSVHSTEVSFLGKASSGLILCMSLSFDLKARHVLCGGCFRQFQLIYSLVAGSTSMRARHT